MEEIGTEVTVDFLINSIMTSRMGGWLGALEDMTNVKIANVNRHKTVIYQTIHETRFDLSPSTSQHPIHIN